MYQNKVIKARLLRAKARFAAGFRGAAHQGILLVATFVKESYYLLTSTTVLVSPLDLQAILQLDPGHREATELLPPAGGKMPTGIGNVSRVALAGANIPSMATLNFDSRIVCHHPHVSPTKFGWT